MTVDKILIDRSVLEQALTTLEGWGNYDKWVWPESALFTAKKNTAEMITALRAALEQPRVEQEPIAWANINKQGDITHTSNKKMAWAKTPLYTHPQPPRQPLTEDEINTIWRNSTHMTIVEVVRAIEAAHGIGGEK